MLQERIICSRLLLTSCCFRKTGNAAKGYTHQVVRDKQTTATFRSLLGERNSFFDYELNFHLRSKLNDLVIKNSALEDTPVANMLDRNRIHGDWFNSFNALLKEQGSELDQTTVELFLGTIPGGLLVR